MSHYVALFSLEVDVVYLLLDARDDSILKFEYYKVKPRLVELESKIGGVLKLLLENCELVDRESLKDDGLGAIRTPDLRRVKATS